MSKLWDAWQRWEIRIWERVQAAYPNELDNASVVEQA